MLILTQRRGFVKRFSRFPPGNSPIFPSGKTRCPRRFAPAGGVALLSPPPAPSRCYSLHGRYPRRNGRGRLFYTSHFKGGRWSPVATVHRRPRRQPRPSSPFGTPGGERKRGKIIYLFGDGVFGGKLLQSPKGDSCRGEGVNTGSRATLSALCPGGLTVAAVFFGKQKKSRRSLKDFLLRGGAGGWRIYCV